MKCVSIYEYFRNKDESQREETAEDECGRDESETGIGLRRDDKAYRCRNQAQYNYVVY
jgi:hypothetical protein